jgi:hypothetical protein
VSFYVQCLYCHLYLESWIDTLKFAFIYNKIYIKELIEKGYRPANEESRELLEDKQIISEAA